MNGNKRIKALGTTVRSEALQAIGYTYAAASNNCATVEDAILKYRDGAQRGTIRYIISEYIAGLGWDGYRQFCAEVRKAYTR